MAYKDPYTAYDKRASRRQRTLGELAGMADNVVSAIVEDRQRNKRKQYRWTDLQGHDRTEMLRQVRDCAMAAMTSQEIADHFGVKVATLNDWVMKDPEFAIAMRLPKALADERVEKALYHRAVGYSFHSEEVKIHDDGRVTRTPVVKHIPPDVGAATFWLKNRRGDVWKDRHDVTVDGNVNLDIEDKANDPRALAMAVLDTLQAAIYQKIDDTVIEHQPAVAVKRITDYTETELQAMSAEELDALYDAAGREE